MGAPNGRALLMIRICLLAAALAVPALAPATATADPTVRYWCSQGGITIDCRQWHTEDVSLHWEVVGATNAPNCPAAVVISREGEHRWTCTATETLPERTTTVRLTAVVRLDKTPPTVAGADADRPADAAGWFRAPVTVRFRGADATSGLASCTVATYAGPDGEGASVTGTCSDVAGLVSAPWTFALRYDATPPEVAAAVPDRAPDHRGWFNRPVGFVIQGADATSGVTTCDAVSVDARAAGPAAVTGTCHDQAGNTASRSFPLRYDAAPPRRPEVRPRPGDGAVVLRLSVGQDTAHVEVHRSPGVRGRRDSVLYTGDARPLVDRRVANGRRYRYRVVAFDAAGNRATRDVVVVPGPRLLSPGRRARLTRPPVLRWTPIRRTRYYNVQLFHDGRRVLSAWPTKARLPLGRRWRYRGRTYELAPGRYRWYVWAADNGRRGPRFGPLVGRRTFVIERVEAPRRRAPARPEAHPLGRDRPSDP